MAYSFTCDLCHRTVEDGTDRVITAAGTYSATGDPVPVSDLPPGGPEIEGMTPVLAVRALYHPACWDAMLAVEPPEPTQNEVASTSGQDEPVEEPVS